MTAWTRALLANAMIALLLIILIFVLKKFKKHIIKYLNFLTALTVGILLGMVFLKFLPEILESGMVGTHIGILILIGLVVFYMMEIFLHFHHCKDLDQESCHDCHQTHAHEHTPNVLMNIGTLLHNVLHGVVLFSAFSVSVEFGISLTLAILLHSIPQNAANYIMNHQKIKSVLIAAGGGLLGVLLLFPFTDFLETHEASILAIIAGGLLYIALSDIFPNLKKSQNGSTKGGGNLIYLLFILLGLTVVFFI